MLKCEMCLGRTLRGEMSVLRSVDRSIEYQAGTAIEITDDTHKINVKVDGITVKLNSNGSLTVDIPDIYAVTAILETLSRYPLDHNYSDLRPLVPNGINQGKWATETRGANNKPIYLDGGVIKASNANLGSSTKPIYMNGGAITESNANVGNNTKPIYMNGGAITESNANVGNNTKPVYMEGGTVKASSANVGTSTSPIYMNGGILTQCNNTLDVNITGNAPKDALSQKIDETYLKGITIGADGTISVTRGDGNISTYTTLKEFIEDVNDDISNLLTDVSQNYVKRTPVDLPSNPMIFNNGSVSYNQISNGYYSEEMTYYYYNGSSYEIVNFTTVLCNELTYDSTKTYYKYNYTLGDYEHFNANSTNFLANRDGLVFFYSNKYSKTYEELYAEGVLYQQTASAGTGDWYSDNVAWDGVNSGLPVPHTGVMTVTSRGDTEISVDDLTLNVNVAFVDKKHRYGAGSETLSVMVIKGHRYRATGYLKISIGFFGD